MEFRVLMIIPVVLIVLLFIVSIFTNKKIKNNPDYEKYVKNKAEMVEKRLIVDAFLGAGFGLVASAVWFFKILIRGGYKNFETGFMRFAICCTSILLVLLCLFLILLALKSFFMGEDEITTKLLMLGLVGFAVLFVGQALIYYIGFAKHYYPEFVDVGFFAKLKYLLRAYGDELIKGGTFLNSFGSIFAVMSIVYAIVGSVKYFFTARSSSEE